MSPLYVDHMFTWDNNHRFFKNLQKRGFQILPSQVEHPGKVFCHFIPLIGSVGRKMTYLEFADVRSKKTRFHNSGLSFGFTKGLETQVVHWRKKGLDTHFLHKNYEWKKDDTSRLPGWNFASFKDTGIRSYYPWVTEYEFWSQRKIPKKVQHKNSVEKIVEVQLQASVRAKEFYKKLLNLKKSPTQEKLVCGTLLNLQTFRYNQFPRVILACRDLETFEKVARPDTWGEYGGRTAAIIKNPNPKSWDIWIVEK